MPDRPLRLTALTLGKLVDLAAGARPVHRIAQGKLIDVIWADVFQGFGDATGDELKDIPGLALLEARHHLGLNELGVTHGWQLVEIDLDAVEALDVLNRQRLLVERVDTKEVELLPAVVRDNRELDTVRPGGDDRFTIRSRLNCHPALGHRLVGDDDRTGMAAVVLDLAL